MLVGLARADLTVWEPGVEMLGWGQPDGRLSGVAMPLNVRALVVDEDGRTVVLVSVELCFVSQSLRDGVLAALPPELGIDPAGLVLTANHTHSGPGGYSHRLLYLLANGGYVASIYAGLVERISGCIVAAWEAREPGRLVFAETLIPASEPVSFNRAMSAYRRNPEAHTEDRALAVDRRMRVLRAESADGRLLGAFTWFPVHCTSLHFDFRRVHPDNKGIAAAQLEADGCPVAAFAQAAAGDVSPNFRLDPARQVYMGAEDTDLASATANGQIQARYAADALSAEGTAIDGGVDARLHWVDFHGRRADTRFTGGTEGVGTARARLGLGFIEGTRDGPGPLWKARWLRRGLVRAVGAWKRLRPQGVDDPYGASFPFLEVGVGGTGLCFGLFRMGRPILPSGSDPVVTEVHRLHSQHADVDSPWSESIVPVQVVRLGPLAIAALPCEPTTVAGARIEADLLAALPGLEHVVVQGYSNAYHGYLTTREEYAEQRYEGGHTVYGQWTLAVYRTALAAIAEALSVPAEDRPDPVGHPPAQVSAEELVRRRYDGAPGTRRW
ncbi:MAG: neutral ceramidase [Myxococcota bacterium]|jgi:neutral ceramidase